MNMDYRKLVLTLVVGASVLIAATPVLARTSTSVLTPEEQAFTRNRQSGVTSVQGEQAVTGQEVESKETRAAVRAAKHNRHKQQTKEIETEYGMTDAKEQRTHKKPVSRNSVLSPEERQFTRERQAGLSSAEKEQFPSVSQPATAVQAPGTIIIPQQEKTTWDKTGWEEQSAREIAADKRQKKLQGTNPVPETPAGYKPQFLLPGNYQEVTIFGPALATEVQAVGLLKLINPKPKLTCTPEEIVHYYWKEAEREGIRPDVTFAQAILESGSFRFGGDVLPSQNNFCGLGTVGGGAKGATFKNPETGVRAHVQHLLAYTSKHPGTKIVDPRYELAHKVRLRDGLCTTWYQLNGNWATSKYYAEKILTVWQRMLGYKDLGGVQVQSDVLAYGRLGE